MKNKKAIVIIIGSSIILIAAAACLLLVNSVSNAPVVSTENFSVDNKMLSCYVNCKMNEYVNFYNENYGSEYFKTVKLDTEKSLKKQKSPYGSTWHDYFEKEAKDELKVFLIYCEAAKKAGIKQSKEELNTALKSIKELYTGKSEDTSSLEKLAKIKGLASDYLDFFKSGIKITEDDKKQYYRDNRDQFDCVDFGCLEVIGSYDISSGSYNPEAADKEMYALAESIKESMETIGFDETVNLYRNNEAVRINEQKLNVIGAIYNDSTQFGNWAFEPSRKTGDAVIFKGNGQYSVYYLKKSAYPLDYTLRTIQRISVDSEDNELVSRLLKIEKELGKDSSEENFEKLAKEQKLSLKKITVKKEDLLPDASSYVYGENTKIGSYRILQDGQKVSLIKICGEAGSYFDTKITESLTELQIFKNLNKLKKEYAIKE